MGFIERANLTAATVRSHAGTRFEPRSHPAGGQSTVEYALVGALVVIAAAGAMTLLGDQVSSVFGHITTTLSGAPAGH